MAVNEKRHSTEAQEWYFGVVNDPNEFGKYAT
jgi:hypothetical protein